MSRSRPLVVIVLFTAAVFLLLAAGDQAVIKSSRGLAGTDPDPAEREGTTPSAPKPRPAKPPGLLTIADSGAELAPGPEQPPTGTIAGGVILPFDAVKDGYASVTTPCENRAWVPIDKTKVRQKPTVLLDPGHGGNEIGAVGPAGLTEKEVNLDVANRLATKLRAEGVRALLTRYSDYRATLSFRAALAGASKPVALVSIHHNGSPDQPLPVPGTETYYQLSSPESKRLAGLIYEEVRAALEPLGADWVGAQDAGAKYRLGSAGNDYYGILRRSLEAGVTAVLAEIAYITNPSEELLLRRDDVKDSLAGALTRAIVRFVRTDDPGSGFVEPFPRSAAAGPGGGRTGCDDPS